MKLINISRLPIRVFFVLILSYNCLYSQSISFPKPSVVFQTEFSRAISKRDTFKIKGSIEKNLKKSFYSAWTALEAKIGSLPACYQIAFQDYKKYIRSACGNGFKINFNFSDEFVTYQVSKGLWFKAGTFPGDHSGLANPRVPNIIDVFNVYSPQWYMLKYSKETGTCMYEAILSEVDLYLCPKGLKINDEYDLLKNYEWSATSEKVYFSIKNMIIHEIFHLVLVHASNSDLMSRFSDEATILDSVAKISSLAGGKGGYGYKFELISWMLDNSHKIKLIEGKSVEKYVEKKYYTGDPGITTNKYIHRKFNPPKDLEYDHTGYDLGGFCSFYPKSSGEPKAADDCRCNKMQRYVIPKMCCKKNN